MVGRDGSGLRRQFQTQQGERSQPCTSCSRVFAHLDGFIIEICQGKRANDGNGHTQVVQSVENKVERLEPQNVELGLLYIPMYRTDMDVRVESGGRFGSNLARGQCATDDTYERRTRALLCFTSFFLNRNCRLRLERSMVSRSSKVMWPKPVSTIFFTAATRSVCRSWS